MGSRTRLGEGFFAPASVSLDFEAWDVSDGCEHCPTWRSERVVDMVGVPVSREWHQPACPVYREWAEDDVVAAAPVGAG